MLVPCVDLGGVLIRHDWESAVSRLRRLSRNPVLKSVSVNSWRNMLESEGIIPDLDLHNITPFDFWRMTLDKFGINPDELDFAEFRRLWTAAMSVNKPLLDLLREIRERVPIMVIASNIHEIHWSHIVKHFPEIPALFDEYMLSGFERVRKPDPAFWVRIALRVRRPTTDLALLDDREENGASLIRLGGRHIPYTERQHLDAERELCRIFDLTRKESIYGC
jgi:FMN phosphatase YigB (HAD superfamily)